MPAQLKRNRINGSKNFRKTSQNIESIERINLFNFNSRLFKLSFGQNSFRWTWKGEFLNGKLFRHLLLSFSRWLETHIHHCQLFLLTFATKYFYGQLFWIHPDADYFNARWLGLSLKNWLVNKKQSSLLHHFSLIFQWKNRNQANSEVLKWSVKSPFICLILQI